MSHEWQLPSKVESSKETRHVIHKLNKPARLTRATIETFEHIPALIPDRSCEHDTNRTIPSDEHLPWCRGCAAEENHPGLLDYPPHEFKMVTLKPYPRCHRCNFDEATQTFRDAVEIWIREEATGRILARTSLIALDPGPASDMHVEHDACIEDGAGIVAHFEHRGAGHDLPKGFKIRLYFDGEQSYGLGALSHAVATAS